MRAISVLSLETGTSTRWCLAAAALRRRVKKSAMGSVCMILLPAGFHHARDFPAQRHAAKTDAAHLKLADIRSEEHTSELQSRLHLVCRLLLEKKKNPPLRPAPGRASSLTVE